MTFLLASAIVRHLFFNSFPTCQLAASGDLFDRIGQKKNYTENDARTLCRKMLESIRFCHANSVAHRDMKPKNLLLVDEDDDCAIKVSLLMMMIDIVKGEGQSLSIDVFDS